MLQDRKFVGRAVSQAGPEQVATDGPMPAAAPARLLKVLLYGLNYAPELTGIGKYSSELCQWLAARGLSVHVVAGHPYYPTWTLAEGYDNHSYQNEIRGNVQISHCPLYLPRKPAAKGRILSH